KQPAGTAPLLKALLNFSEIVKIVFHDNSAVSFRTGPGLGSFLGGSAFRFRPVSPACFAWLCPMILVPECLHNLHRAQDVNGLNVFGSAANQGAEPTGCNHLCVWPQLTQQ